MSTEVYIVTEGEYSDYHIVDVFLDKEKAEFFARFHTDDGKVETYYTGDDEYIVKVETITFYEICLNNDGTVKKCEMETYDCIPGEDDFLECFPRTVLSDGFYGTIIADSEEQAIKIAQDKRAQWLAEKYGI